MDSVLQTLLFKRSGYLDRFKFQLAASSVLVVFLVFRYFEYTHFVNALAIALVVAGVLYVQSSFYFTQHKDNNQLLDYKLNQLQSLMYSFVDDQMNRIVFSENNKLLTRKIYKQSLNRVKLTHFYIDSRIIRFCHSLSFLYQYNNNSFANVMLAINGILRIRTELEEYYNVNGELPPSVSYDVQTVEELHKKAVNFAHTFIYTIPKTNNLEYTIEKILSTMYRLLKPHVIAVKRMAIKRDIKVGVHRRTQFTELNYSISKPIDSLASRISDPRYNKKLDSHDRFELYV